MLGLSQWFFGMLQSKPSNLQSWSRYSKPRRHGSFMHRNSVFLQNPSSTDSSLVYQTVSRYHADIRKQFPKHRSKVPRRASSMGEHKSCVLLPYAAATEVGNALSFIGNERIVVTLSASFSNTLFSKCMYKYSFQKET